MGNPIVPLCEAFTQENARQWENEIFHQMCKQAQETAQAYLAALEEELFAHRPAGWKVIGFRERVLVTRFGEVQIQRRLYQDAQGDYHFLLDEYLGLSANQVATPEMQEMCAHMAAELSFRKVTEILHTWMAGLLSTSTCWRLLQRTGQAAVAAETVAIEAVFGSGDKLAAAGERQVERLYMEADGLYVRLQRQPGKHLEVHCAIAYEGWERLPATRESYRLREKRVYCHAGEQASFWEGVSLAWGHKWDLAQIGEVILGGDGAKWIRAGTQELPETTWQLDSYHLARACGRALGAEVGQAVYQALRAGQTAQAQTLLHNAGPPGDKGQQAQQAYNWVAKVAQEEWGVDWRIRQQVPIDTERGLGSMEGNLAQLLAARMKAKGRSWSPEGALHMAKVRELMANRELRSWCFRQALNQIPNKDRNYNRPSPQATDPTQVIQASVPALYGPHSDKPWVRRLRQRIHPSHLLN
jgi:hypothetical protein